MSAFGHMVRVLQSPPAEAPQVSPAPSSSGVRRGRPPSWSAEEDAALREHYVRDGVAACAERLPGRTRAALKQRARQIGVAGIVRPWTHEEEVSLIAAWRHGGFGDARALDDLAARSDASLRWRYALLKARGA